MSEKLITLTCGKVATPEWYTVWQAFKNLSILIQFWKFKK